MAEHAAAVAHQFDDAEQQRGAAELGMWIFLATEVMFFGGMFTAFTAYRWLYPAGFAHASRHLDVLLGGINPAGPIGPSPPMGLAGPRPRGGPPPRAPPSPGPPRPPPPGFPPAHARPRGP